MQLEQLLSSTTSESIAESLHTVMIGVEDKTGAVATDGGAPGSAERDVDGPKPAVRRLRKGGDTYITKQNVRCRMLPRVGPGLPHPLRLQGSALRA